MFVELVSGRKKNRNTRQNPDTHISSQTVQVQPSACAAKPPTSGPRTSPQTALILQIAKPYACFFGGYISEMEAPPVARAGEPNKPVKNRKARSMPKFVASAVGI